MVSIKVAISLIAIILTFVGYVPYIRDILKRKTTPHAFTWFVFSVSGGTAAALQILGGGGVGSWPLVIAVIACFIIFFLSLRIGNKDITGIDIICLLLSLIALFIWLVIKQPIWSAVMATAAEIIGFFPTIRKSWNNPYSETLFSYEVAFFRHGISLFALQRFNVLTVLYPVAWTLTNLIFVPILIIRRKKHIRSQLN